MSETYSSDSSVFSVDSNSSSNSTYEMIVQPEDNYSHDFDQTSPLNLTCWSNGLLRYNNGQRLSKYLVEEKLGEGTFGTVYKVKNLKKNTYCALKQQSTNNFNEINMLTRIKDFEIFNDQRQHVLMHLDYFKNDCEQFIAFPLLGCDLLEYVTLTNFTHFEGPVLKRIALQMLKGLDYLHTIDVIHADLKLNNVMFVDPKTREMQGSTSKQLSMISSDIKWIDLGLARVDEDAKHSVPALPYRSPEVVFGMGMVEKSDVWTLGCILFELWTQFYFFDMAEDPKELIALLTYFIGPIPPDYINFELFFTFENGSERQRFINRIAELQPYRHPLDEYHNSRTMDIGGYEEAQFVDLLRKMLTWKTECRLTTNDALNHPYFS